MVLRCPKESLDVHDVLFEMQQCVAWGWHAVVILCVLRYITSTGKGQHFLHAQHIMLWGGTTEHCIVAYQQQVNDWPVSCLLVDVFI